MSIFGMAKKRAAKANRLRVAILAARRAVRPEALTPWQEGLLLVSGTQIMFMTEDQEAIEAYNREYRQQYIRLMGEAAK